MVVIRWISTLLPGIKHPHLVIRRLITDNLGYPGNPSFHSYEKKLNTARLQDSVILVIP